MDKKEEMATTEKYLYACSLIGMARALLFLWEQGLPATDRDKQIIASIDAAIEAYFYKKKCSVKTFLNYS